ncbi:MAG: putative rane protein, partial [bacterium]|nr:putative rane protein [bacterium]
AFQTATGLISVLVQWKLTRPSLRRFGLAGSVALLPVASLGGGMLAALLPRLTSVTLMRAAEGVMKTSLFRAAYELLYTPLAPARKRATKALIDVGFDRIGTAVGSGLTMLALFIVPVGDIRLLLGIGATAALASVLVSRRLHSGYVSALEEGLRSGHAQVEQGDWSASPWMPLEGPWQARKAIKLVEHGASPAPPRLVVAASSPSLSPTSRARTTNAAVMRAIADLRSGSAKRIRKVLADGIDRDLVLAAHVIPLLARDDVAVVVAARLKPIAARISGQLADALLDRGSDVKLRQRAARILAAAPSPFAVAALVQALDDDSFAVRHGSAMSLARLTELDPGLRFDSEQILGVARREIERGRQTWGKETLLERDDDGEPIADELRERANRSLAQVVAVLSLVLEREPLWIAYHALHTDDDQLRGTALEYLENILPEDLRAALWPLLGVLQPGRAERRAHHQIAEDLLSAKQTVLEHLRRLTGAVTSSS